MRKIFTAILAIVAGVTIGAVQLVAPAHAACGDTTAEWVDPTIGSAWSGTLDGTTPFTVILAPEVLGLRTAATVIVVQSGVGTWVHDYNTRWTASLAGVWDYHFEVSATACTTGVTEASGGATDALDVVHPVTMTRTL